MPDEKKRKPSSLKGPGKDVGPVGPGRPDEPPESRWKGIGWLAAALVAFLVAQALFFPGSRSDEVTFSRFLDLVDDGRVTEANISSGDVTGKFGPEAGSEEEATEFVTTIPPNYETNQLVDILREQDVEVTATQPSPWAGLLVSLLPFLIILGIYFIWMRRMRSQLGGGAGPLSFGKNKAKLYDRTDLKTTFDDVAGVDEVETELQEIVEYLSKPQKFEMIGARIPKGVLLVGPPGTGKTLLARAVAGEANVPFFYISASEFIEMFVGLGAARVRDLFKQARERAPAIVFIDEIDSIGQSRAGAAGNQLGAHQEQEQTLQQLLTEMDGFEPNSGVIIIAASNRPEVLDPALLRPGRFDRQIVVNLPNIAGREEILRIHARNVKLAPDVELKVLARRTPGFSGAQLANVINEAALLSARKDKEVVSMVELEEAIDRVLGGLERRSTVLTEEERRLVAFHELGHALVAMFTEHSDPVHRVSIIPRGVGALGYTQQLPDEERYLMTEPQLKAMIAVLLGGRAAEDIVFGLATTGAGDDLRRATEIARRMVMEFGMSEKVGPINLAEQGGRFLAPSLRPSDGISDETEVAIDREVKSLLMSGRETASSILREHRADLDELATILLDQESLSRHDLESFFQRKGSTVELPSGSNVR